MPDGLHAVHAPAGAGLNPWGWAADSARRAAIAENLIERSNQARAWTIRAVRVPAPRISALVICETGSQDAIGSS